ncbi:probable RNA-binding protein 46 [Trichonephila clavata]|uniref:Probable RNA-binding protein 46 n=1 Tax=Trichonephila clavata TaxID=2740835 RepID=A0A8X6HN24_TRICU|nr:probable RNA-binding protein 46 [Trichonephila clavata]
MAVPSCDLRQEKSNYVYKFTQVNGQRICGPPEGWDTLPQPPKGCEVFIGKLPRDMYEDELMPLLEQIGIIYEFRLMMDFSGATRGYAFVTYTNKEDAERAIEILDRLEVRPGKRIGAMKSVDNCKLRVDGIPTHKTNDEVHSEIIKFTEGVERTYVVSDPADKTKNKGFAFIEYKNHRYASKARRVLIGGSVKLFGRKTAFNWADPEIDVNENDLKEDAVLAIRNLPVFVNEYFLNHYLSLKGNEPIKKIVKHRDTAFVLFSNKKNAEKVLLEFNGTHIEGHAIEVTWANKANLLNSSGTSKRLMYDNRQQSRLYCKNPIVSNCTPVERSMSVSPVQMLEYICFQNGYDPPYYHIYHVIDGSCNSNVTFNSKVFIKSPFWEKWFSSEENFSTPQESKLRVALKALSNIGGLINDTIFPCNYSQESIVRTVQQPPPPSLVPIPGACNPMKYGIGPGINSYHPSTYGGPYNPYLLATAVCLANLQLQANSNNQN